MAQTTRIKFSRIPGIVVNCGSCNIATTEWKLSEYMYNCRIIFVHARVDSPSRDNKLTKLYDNGQIQILKPLVLVVSGVPTTSEAVSDQQLCSLVGLIATD